MSRWLERARRSLIGRRFRPGEVVVLVGDGVFAAPALAEEIAPARVASLEEYVAALAARPLAPGALPAGVFREARSVAGGLAELRFALTQLVPTLRATGGSARPSRPSVRGLRGLERRGAELLRRLDRVPRVEGPEIWTRQLPVPCAIVSQSIVPVEPDAPSHRTPRATIDGRVYGLRLDSARPFRAVELRVRKEATRSFHSALAEDRELRGLAEEVVDGARSIVSRTEPRERGCYQLVHHDPIHQLHHSAGSWMLVRGPVTGLAADRALYVGLPLRGRTRAERLGWSPVPARTPEGLWYGRGEPRGGAGLCMGLPGQYRLLRSRRLTDAEAVIEWLDAGVVLATGRPEFHRRWRRQIRRLSTRSASG